MRRRGGGTVLLARDAEGVCVSTSASIRDAMQVLDRGGVGIVLVLEGLKLCGVLTDGDIRRALLRRVPLESAVGIVMTTTPVTAPSGIDAPAARELMHSHGVRQLPLLDQRGAPIAVALLDDLIPREQYTTPVVIMAGGLGTRLRPLTDDIPKPLIRIGGRAIIDTIIDELAHQSFNNVIVTAHYRAEQLEEHLRTRNVRVIREPERLGTAGSLVRLADVLDEPFLVVNADLLTTFDFREFVRSHRRRRPLVTLAVCENALQLRFGLVDVEGSRVISLREKPYLTFFVNAGIYAVDPAALALVPQGRSFDMTEVISAALERGDSVDSFPVREFWMDIGTPEDLQRAVDHYATHFSGRYERSTV